MQRQQCFYLLVGKPEAGKLARCTLGAAFFSPDSDEPDQPQLSLGLYPVDDPQAIRNPRPDTTYFAPGNDGAGGSRMIQWGWNPVGGASADDAGLTPNYLVSKGYVGDVTVVTT